MALDHDLQVVPRWAPRLVVGPGNRRQSLQALSFYRPTSRRGKSGVTALRSLLAMGGRLAVVALGRSADSAALRAAVGALRSAVDEGPPFAIVGWLGAPGDDRKHTLMAVDQEGTPRAYAKVNATDVSRHLVRQEASALQLLGATELASFVPEILSSHEVGAYTVCVTAPATGVTCASDSSLTGDHVAFLKALQNLTGAIAEPAPSPRTALSHGDFTPWNCLEADGRLRSVLDWEFLGYRSPTFDVCHYEVQIAVHFAEDSVNEAALRVSARLIPLLAEHWPGCDPHRAIAEYCEQTLLAIRAGAAVDRARALRQALMTQHVLRPGGG